MESSCQRDCNLTIPIGRHTKSLLVLLLIIQSLALVACQVEAQSLDTGKRGASVSTPAVDVTEQVTAPTSTPIACSPMPLGMQLSVQAISSSAVEIRMTGLEPGTKLLFVLNSENGAHSYRIEEHPIDPVGSDGRYAWKVNGLTPSGAHNTETHWQLQVVHSRGVACTSFTIQ